LYSYSRKLSKKANAISKKVRIRAEFSEERHEKRILKNFKHRRGTDPST